MKLSGREYQQLQQALISAFPRRTDLEQMFLFQLGEPLDSIVGSGNLSDTVFSLIQWAVARGRLGELITGARSYNPGNAELRVFVEQVWQAKTAEQIQPTDGTVALANPLTSQADSAERAHLKALLTIQQGNLQKLELQEASYGAGAVPLHILNQLDAVRSEITKLEALLNTAHAQEQPGEPCPTRPAVRRHDTYSSYETALEQLLRRLGSQHARYAEALIYQQRLSENVNTSRRYGDTETSRAERARIIGQLNSMTLETLGKSFNELM